MRQALHLVSLPMHDPLQPSAQLGYLHGHATRNLADVVETQSYSGHFDVLWLWKGLGMREAYFAHRLFGEELFFLACCHDHPVLFERAFTAYAKFRAPLVHADRAEIASLSMALKQWTRRVLAPALSPDRLNVIGFSTTFAQVFSSILVCRELQLLAPAPMLFIFGGASVTMPETRQSLALWGVDGLVVQSNGEAPLEALVRAIDTLPEEVSAVDTLTGAKLSNISRIGSLDAPIDLGISRTAMAAIGDPDYNEFFEKLARFCPDSQLREQLLVSVPIPVEGSRGCFAKCDFCQNPLITSAFRTLDGNTVAARVQRLAEQYNTAKIYFADSVCNSWADDYAVRMIADGVSLQAFMELRVHASEQVFTRLALAGVNEVQLGVEAVSEPLLSAMRKGTKVWQNLRAVKYLAELGIRSVSNLITHHPRSTAEDVRETVRVMEALTHLTRFSLSHFVVSFGSPIWHELGAEAQAALRRGFLWLPEDLRPYSTQRDLAYPYPTEWLDPAATEAWDAFRRDWGQTETAPEILQMNERHEVIDGRDGKMLRHRLDADAALLLELGHQAPKYAEAADQVGLDARRFDTAMSRLRDTRLVLDLNDRFLSLPLRPRSTLAAAVNSDPRHDQTSELALSLIAAERADRVEKNHA